MFWLFESHCVGEGAAGRIAEAEDVADGWEEKRGRKCAFPGAC